MHDLPVSQEAFMTLLGEALPSGYPLARLVLPDDSGLELKEYLASSLGALSASADLDWEAYLDANPDVRQAGVAADVHFIQSGLWEGRKLCIKHEVMAELDHQEEVGPKISVVVACHNHALFLKKLLDNLAAQTLRGLEIIIVDDASSDASVSLLREPAKNVKIIIFAARQGRHMSRKAGVKAASGQYILFLDATDLLVPDACETIYNAAATGFDIACFNVGLIGSGAQDVNIAQINRGTAQNCQGYEIMDKIFVNRELSDALWNKLYKADICKSAFAEMVDGFYEEDADIYEALVLASRARTLCKINRSLYLRRMGYIGGQNQENGLQNPLDERNSNIWPIVRDFLEASGYYSCLKTLKERLLQREVKKWLGLTTPREITGHFNHMAASFGIAELITQIAVGNFRDWERVANVFCKYTSIFSGIKSHAHIGILFGLFGNGGTEMVIRSLASLLSQRGHKVTLFLERSGSNDVLLPKEVEIVYVPLEYYSETNVTNNIYAFATILRKNMVDVMFCEACWSEALLWQTMLFKYMNIPVIMHNHMAFFDRLLWGNSDFGLQAHDSVLRCADKVLCLSRFSELYNHILGIDAVCIANPVRVEQRPTGDFESRRLNVVILGRIGDVTKRMPDALRAVAEIASELPDIMATFVGELRTEAEWRQFRELVSALGIQANVHVTGWTPQPLSIVANAAVLLSCAYQESFGLAICEAQSLGLPCVIYDLPIMPAEANPSIIRVPHGDVKAAAREIVALLTDKVRWTELSRIARENVKRFSPNRFIGRVMDMLSNLGKQSEISWYAEEDYRILGRVLGFYAGDLPPWQEVGCLPQGEQNAIT